MVTMDSSISFLIYITAVSSAAAGITELVKSLVPFLGTDYEAANDCLEDHNAAGRLHQWKKVINVVLSAVSASIIFGLLGLDPAKILAGEAVVNVEDPWQVGIWVWGVVAIFAAPFFHSVLKILEGLKQSMSENIAPKPKRKVSGRK